MKKFEYIKVNASNWINEVSTEEQFDGEWEERRLDEVFGANGWELCAIKGIYYYFKRQLED
jgi:hypothetical protein